MISSLSRLNNILCFSAGAALSSVVLLASERSVHPSNPNDRTAGVALSRPASEVPFFEENEAAMSKMMADMDVNATGDIDRDFVAMMVPHHQGAIEMAQAVLRHGKNEQIRRLAQEIVVTQQQEIAAMRLAIGESATGLRSSPVTTRRDDAKNLYITPRSNELCKAAIKD